MRVLAIAQPLRQRAREGAAARSLNLHRIRHPVGHRRVIGRRPRIGVLRQPLAHGQIGAALRVQLRQHLGIVLHIDDDAHKGVVLRRRADHRRAADVDILDAIVIAAALGDGFFKRVQVHHQQVDHPDPMFGSGRLMPGIVAQRQKPAMHDRMQRLDAAVHHLGEAGDLGHVLDRDPCLAQGLGGAAGRQDLDPFGVKRTGKVDQPGLVRDRDQGAFQRDDILRHGDPAAWRLLVGA